MKLHGTISASSWLLVLSAGVAISCCSCTTARSLARTEDFSDEVQKAKQQRTVTANYEQVSEKPAASGFVRLGQEKKRSDIQLMSHEEASCPPDAITSCPPEPRTPVMGPNPFAVGMPHCEQCQLPDPNTYADEYLCDGGDREWPVHYDSQQRLGLDTEDTVVEYVDHKGAERMKPANKVCVYAPRFAAVRTISQPVLGESLEKSVGMINTTGDDELRTRVASVQKTKRDPASNIRVRSRAGGVETEMAGANVQQDVAAARHDKINNLFQGFLFTVGSDLDQSTAARLNYGLGAAVAWSREDSPVISGQIEQPFEGLIELSVATLTVIDDQPSDEPGQLQIAKFADKKEAHPGDEITFTIRYRNAGPREVHHVKIVDNLTPRLAFIDDSVTSDRDITLDDADNGEGSLVLTFELEQSLPVNAAGVITFRARVR